MTARSNTDRATAVARRERAGERRDQARPVVRGAIEHDRAGARRNDTHQAFQCRAFAGAVASEQRDDFVALDRECHIEQDVGVGVVGVQALDLEQAHVATTPPR